MDIRNISADMQQRRPSLSSLSSASGYTSSGYGGVNPNSRVNTKNLNGLTSVPVATPNVWMNSDSSLNDVAPWVEQQKQQQSKVGTLDLKDKKNGASGISSTPSPGATKAQIISGNGNKDNETHESIDEDDSFDDDHDDELIPTAIVIKNIPFAIKKEQLLDVMTKLNLPLPYAFNYHFDNGVFRGLAFANFTSTDETSLVVNQLNGREIGGRKLRVEYKKMLPAQERERIEREKREKRGQLEEQHRSTSNASLASLMSATSTTAATKNLSVNGTSSQPERLFLNYPSSSFPTSLPNEVNFNDVEILELFTQLVIFKDDSSKHILELAYPPNLPINHRKALTSLCSYLNLLELYDNGLIIIRRKPGQLFQVLNSITSPLAENATTATSTSMLNLAQLNNAPAPGLAVAPGHPELLRSHSQTAMPVPRMRQQQNSTPIQQQFPTYAPNGKPLYQGIQPFGFNQANLLPNQLNGALNPSTSAAAILRNSNGSSRGSYDMRSTPPLANTFTSESPTPTPHHTHSTLLTGESTKESSASANGTQPTSQPSTPLQSADINLRFAPFGQHSQLTGSLSSLPTTSNDLNDLNGKFNSINLSYESNGSGAAAAAGGSGIWGPK